MKAGNVWIKAFMCHGCQTCWELVEGEIGTEPTLVQHPHCLSQEDMTDQATLYAGALKGIVARASNAPHADILLSPLEIAVLDEISKFLYTPPPDYSKKDPCDQKH